MEYILIKYVHDWETGQMLGLYSSGQTVDVFAKEFMQKRLKMSQFQDGKYCIVTKQNLSQPVCFFYKKSCGPSVHVGRYTVKNV